MYAKVKDGVLQYAPLNYLTDDNKLILNFNKNIEAMVANGFKEVINIVPSYDASKQIVKQDGFTETENAITINYVVEDNPAYKEAQFDIQKNLALSFLAENLSDEQAAKLAANTNGKSWKTSEDTWSSIKDGSLKNGITFKNLMKTREAKYGWKFAEKCVEI